MTQVPIPTSDIDISQPESTALQHQPFFKKWGGLFVITLGLVIVVIDTTLLNVSLGTIIKDLHTNIQDLQWVITAYALALAALTITGGRFGDLFGRRKMFMIGAGIFAVGSFIASISHNIPTLLLGESIIEGVGAALMMPATASLLVANFTGADRAKAFGIWGAAAGASSAIGPLLGGYLTSHFSWRWGFRINIFVAAIVIIGSLIMLKESRDERKPKLDWWGVFLSSTGLLALVYGIIESSTYGWWKTTQVFSLFGNAINLGGFSIVPFALLLGAIILAIFFWWELKLEKEGRSPLVSMHLFQNGQFTAGTSVISILTLAMTGQIFALPIFLQSVKGFDALSTGLALLPLSAALIVVAPLTGLFSKKVSPKVFILAGLFIDVIAAFILRWTLNQNVQISHLIPGLALYGIGMGMVFAPISNYTLSSVPAEMSGEASGVNNTFRQIGSTLGAAIIGAAILTSVGASLAKGIQASPVIPTELKPALVQNVTNPNANIEFGGNGQTSQLPPAVTTELKSLTNQATTNASRDAYVYNAMFALLAFAVGLFLPNTRVREGHMEAVPESQAWHKIKYALSGLIIILAIGGGVLILKNSANVTIASASSGQNSPAAQTAQDIRSLFPPPPTQNQNPPVAVLPTSTTETILPRGQDSQPVNNLPVPAPSPLPVPAPSPATPIYTTYTNTALGFQMQMSSLWQAQENSQNNAVAFTNAQGQQYTVESYSDPAETLSEVKTQLSQSSSAIGVTDGSFAGQPAVIFKTQDGKSGAAVVYNNRVFYIFGPDLTSPPISGFKFI